MFELYDYLIKFKQVGWLNDDTFGRHLVKMAEARIYPKSRHYESDTGFVAVDSKLRLLFKLMSYAAEDSFEVRHLLINVESMFTRSDDPIPLM